MSTIPDEIKQKIADHYWFVDEEDFDETYMSYDDYVKERMALQRAAAVGYSLASQRIQELEKEVERLQKMNNELMSKLSVQAD